MNDTQSVERQMVAYPDQLATAILELLKSNPDEVDGARLFLENGHPLLPEFLRGLCQPSPDWHDIGMTLLEPGGVNQLLEQARRNTRLDSFAQQTQELVDKWNDERFANWRR